MLPDNPAFGYLGLRPGPFFYGYGFVPAMLRTALLVLGVTGRVIERLPCTTFMLR